jgi:hypothetical protein
MVKYLINVVLGMIGTLILLLFSVIYGFACVVLGWAPDISFKIWAFVTISLSSAILIISFCTWRFTEFKEGIHGWILVPELFLGKLWISSIDEVTFLGFMTGSIFIGIVLIILAGFEMVRTRYRDVYKGPQNKDLTS